MEVFISFFAIYQTAKVEKTFGWERRVFYKIWYLNIHALDIHLSIMGHYQHGDQPLDVIGGCA